MTLPDDAIEVIKGKLFFVTLPISAKPRNGGAIHYFCIDDELVYENFYADFGPLNLAQLYKYCKKVERKVQTLRKPVVHYTSTDARKRSNAAYLIGCYAIIYAAFTPEKIYQRLIGKIRTPFLAFRDAAFGPCTYQLTLLDCFHAIDKALEHQLLNFDKFDVEEYEYYERVENGDFNWILKNKFLAFCGPHAKSKLENGYPFHAPEAYFPYFRKNNVTTIIRLNKKMYDGKRFKAGGFDHHELFFTDGSCPPERILHKFLEIVESAEGAIAVHCKAGLGRTGTLICCYMMKHYKFSAAEAIAWCRMCRPGSVIGPQQHYLEDKQPLLWLMGDDYRRSNLKIANQHNTLTTILSGVQDISLEDLRKDENNNDSEDEALTQGDALLVTKARRHSRGLTIGVVSEVTEGRPGHKRSGTLNPKATAKTSASGLVSPLKTSKVSLKAAPTSKTQTSFAVAATTAGTGRRIGLRTSTLAARLKRQ